MPAGPGQQHSRRTTDKKEGDVLNELRRGGVALQKIDLRTGATYTAGGNGGGDAEGTWPEQLDLSRVETTREALGKGTFGAVYVSVFYFSSVLS